MAGKALGAEHLLHVAVHEVEHVRHARVQVVLQDALQAEGWERERAALLSLTTCDAPAHHSQLSMHCLQSPEQGTNECSVDCAFWLDRPGDRAHRESLPGGQEPCQVRVRE